MKIQNVQSINFEAKQRFVTSAMRGNINLLMNKMNDGTTYSSNGDFFKSTIFKELSTKNNRVKFQDGRIYLGDKLKRKDLKGEALFTIGKTELVIDNKTGEIIDYYKPFFTSWKTVMKKAEKYLEFFKENFDNETLVKQKMLSMQGFTEQGQKKIEKLKAEING